MTNVLQSLRDKEALVAVGLMSGTSMDGVDAALVRFGAPETTSVELLDFNTTPYPGELRATLMEVAFGEQCTAEDIATLHTSVAVAFANATHALCNKAGITIDKVDFVASHGQTIAHIPPAPGASALIAGTLQLGPPGMIAALTGVTTVGDFRVADIALGGQGAPLAPYVDYRLRRSDEHDRVILNVGGIANITYLPKRRGVDQVIAFDTGPGNMVLDELYRVLYPGEIGYAKLEEESASGKPSLSMVDTFMRFPFFEQKPPKSAGHREFGSRFAWELLAKAQSAGMAKRDILATAVALTVSSIESAFKRFIDPVGEVDQVFVTGGGSHNRAIMSELASRLAPASVSSIDELGIPADAKESVDFAVLGRETLLGRYNVVPRATGAARPAVLGAIALGSL